MVCLYPKNAARGARGSSTLREEDQEGLDIVQEEVEAVGEAGEVWVVGLSVLGSALAERVAHYF